MLSYNQMFTSAAENYLVYEAPEWYDIKSDDYILSTDAELVNYKKYNGYIFPKNFLWYPYCLEDPLFKWDNLKYYYPYAVTKYTPSHKDTETAEKIISKNIKKYALQFYGYIPDCLNNLNKYTRQYFGISYKSNTLNKSIYVNLVNTDSLVNYINPKTSEPYKIDQTYVPIQITDEPGESTIEILINLTDKKIISLNM